MSDRVGMRVTAVDDIFEKCSATIDYLLEWDEEDGRYEQVPGSAILDCRCDEPGICSKLYLRLLRGENHDDYEGLQIELFELP